MTEVANQKIGTSKPVGVTRVSIDTRATQMISETMGRRKMAHGELRSVTREPDSITP